MVVDERGVASSSDLQFLDQVKRAIGMREPPRVITICKGDMDGHNILSIQPYHESADHTSIEATNASCDSSIINSDCASISEMKSDHGLPTHRVEGGSSYQELHLMIRTLYDQLQTSDSKLARERERRKARERNIATMANEIISQKQRIEEMKGILRDERVAKAKLEKNLEHKHLAVHEDQQGMCRNLQQKLRTAREMYDTACVDRERRIRDMSEAHAKQCNLLCREVVESNRENKLLRERIELLEPSKNKLTPFDGVDEKTKPESDDGPNAPKRMKSVLNLFAFIYAVFAIFVFNGSPSTRRHSLSSFDPSTAPNHNSSYHSMHQISQRDTRLRSRVFFPPAQERQQENPGDEWNLSKDSASKSSSPNLTRQRLQAQVGKVGTKLKKVVVTDGGEMRREIPIQHPFLTLKATRFNGDDEQPPEDSKRLQSRNTPLIVEWFQNVKGFIT